MSQTTPFDLNRTVAATWRRQLTGPRSEEKTHWKTKVAYYTAACELIAADPSRPLSWQLVVDAVRPKGSRSTFYEVAGRRAKYPLIRAYRDVATTDALQIAYTYQRSAATDLLIDEAKVWAFWPYRQGWVHHCHETRGLYPAGSTESLTAVLADWAQHNAGLASALDYAPPTCAVEDLVAVHGHRLPAMRAHAVLREAIRDAVPQGPDPVLDVVMPWHRSGGPEPTPSSPDQVLTELAERIYAVSMDVRRLPHAEAAMVRDGASVLMNDALTELAELGAP